MPTYYYDTLWPQLELNCLENEWKMRKKILFSLCYSEMLWDAFHRMPNTKKVRISSSTNMMSESMEKLEKKTIDAIYKKRSEGNLSNFIASLNRVSFIKHSTRLTKASAWLLSTACGVFMLFLNFKDPFVFCDFATTPYKDSMVEAIQKGHEMQENGEKSI